MRQSVTMRFDPAVLAAARGKAKRDNRTLTNYVETLMRRDLEMRGAEPMLEVIAPPDARDFVPLPMPGESAEDYQRRVDIAKAILDAGGY